jgi:hypothetical protein
VSASTAHNEFNPRSRQAARISEAWSCIAEAEAWAHPGCPDCDFVLESLKRGAVWELSQLDWMRA